MSYDIDLIKCVFTNKIKISFSPSWHIPKRFNAWKILLNASPRKGPRECICVADPPARPRASLPPRAYKRCRGWQQASFFSNTNTKSNINTNTHIKYQYKYIHQISIQMQNQISIFLSFSIIKCVIFPLMRKSFPRRYVWKVNHSRKNLPMLGQIMCIRFMVSTKICSLHILHTAPCTMHCTKICVGGERGGSKIEGKVELSH